MAQMITGKDREETIRLTARATGMSIDEATNIYAIEHGENFGDVIVLDAKGKPMPMARQPNQEPKSPPKRD